MNLDEAVSVVLERRMPRVQVKASNGLSRNMNQCIRSYPELPEIIRRTVGFLASTEILFNFTGAVRVDGMDIYRALMELHDDWVKEIPYMRGSELKFQRRFLLPYHQFSAAWTIGRRIGLIQGRGEIGLSRSALTELRELLCERDQAVS